MKILQSRRNRSSAKSLSTTVSPLKLEASLCRESFYDFFCRFWSITVPAQLVSNWHIRFLCQQLQKIAERKFANLPKEGDLIINISPGSTKSTICSVMFPAWCWTRDASSRFICASHTQRLSLNLARKCRNVVQSKKYMMLFPEVVLATEGSEEIETTKGGMRFATSIGGTVTGMHADIQIVDDPIDPQGTRSEIDILAAKEWFNETLFSRKTRQEGVPLILIMQRLHQADPTGFILERSDPVKHICLPAELTEDVKPKHLRMLYKDDLMDPVRLSKANCESARRVLGDVAYAAQYLQRPVPREGALFKIGGLRIEETTASPTFVRIVRYWDKAATEGDGAFTVGVKMAVDKDGYFWILDVVRGQWEAAYREKVIELTAALDGKGVLIGVEQEPGSGGKESAQATVRRLAGYRVKVDRPTGDKILRADPFAVQVNGGNVRLLRAGWNREYIEEMQFFPYSKNKDQIDASSGAFAILSAKKRKAGAF